MRTPERNPKLLKRRSGFTLMELSIAILIISILIGAGMYGYESFQNNAKKTVAKQELRTLASACASYAMDHSSKEPAKLTDLLTAVPPYIKAGTNWTEKNILDPWGTPYVLKSGKKGHGTITVATDGYTTMTMDF